MYPIDRPRSTRVEASLPIIEMTSNADQEELISMKTTGILCLSSEVGSLVLNYNGHS